MTQIKLHCLRNDPGTQKKGASERTPTPTEKSRYAPGTNPPVLHERHRPTYYRHPREPLIDLDQQVCSLMKAHALGLAHAGQRDPSLLTAAMARDHRPSECGRPAPRDRRTVRCATTTRRRWRSGKPVPRRLESAGTAFPSTINSLRHAAAATNSQRPAMNCRTCRCRPSRAR